MNCTPRARPPMRRGLKPRRLRGSTTWAPAAARAARDEQETETKAIRRSVEGAASAPRARPPMRRGLKQFPLVAVFPSTPAAARAAPYEKGTETNVSGEWDAGNRVAARAVPYEIGTETRSEEQT